MRVLPGGLVVCRCGKAATYARCRWVGTDVVLVLRLTGLHRRPVYVLPAGVKAGVDAGVETGVVAGVEVAETLALLAADVTLELGWVPESESGKIKNRPLCSGTLKIKKRLLRNGTSEI